MTRIKTNLGLDQADQQALTDAAKALIHVGLQEVGGQNPLRRWIPSST